MGLLVNTDEAALIFNVCENLPQPVEQCGHTKKEQRQVDREKLLLGLHYETQQASNQYEHEDKNHVSDHLLFLSPLSEPNLPAFQVIIRPSIQQT